MEEAKGKLIACILARTPETRATLSIRNAALQKTSKQLCPNRVATLLSDV